MDPSYRKLRTVELQKRKVTQSKNASNLSERKLANVYAPKNFDEDSTIVVCNFPQHTTMNDCKNFMQWIGPVIKVEKIPSFMQENNYLVVFSNPHFAKVTPGSLVRLTPCARSLRTRGGKSICIRSYPHYCKPQKKNIHTFIYNSRTMQAALETQLIYENKTKLFIRLVEKRDTLWKNINDMISTNIGFFS